MDTEFESLGALIVLAGSRAIRIHVCMAVSNTAGAMFLLMGHACLLGYLNSFVVVVLPPNALGFIALRAMVPYQLFTF